MNQSLQWWRSRLVPLAVLVAAVALFTACDGAGQAASPDEGGDTGTGSAGDSIEGNDLSGAVSIDGSSTVFPVTEAVAEEFMAANRDVQVTVGVSGTGGGFQRFCAGETDISDASREIDEDEASLCEQNGVEWLRLRVGLDGLAVVTNAGNEFLDAITMEELETIWEPAAEGTITRWNQVNPAWPDTRIALFGPGVASGTFDFFTETVMGEAGTSRADYSASEDDNTLVVGVSGSEGSLGYFGYAYYAENQDRLRVVPVDTGGGSVTPSDETVADESYPLARPLYLYLNVDSLNEKPQVREFVRSYLSDEGIELVPQVGYTAIPQDELTESREALEAAITSS